MKKTGLIVLRPFAAHKKDKDSFGVVIYPVSWSSGKYFPHLVPQRKRFLPHLDIYKLSAQILSRTGSYNDTAKPGVIFKPSHLNYQNL